MSECSWNTVTIRIPDAQIPETSKKQLLVQLKYSHHPNSGCPNTTKTTFICSVFQWLSKCQIFGPVTALMPCVWIQWGSEIWTSLDLKWSKKDGLQMVRIWNGISNREAQPFEIQTNGNYFVKTIWNPY